MKLLDRPQYLDRLVKTRATPDIKVITGIRRSGKSKLMQMFIEWIRTNEADANVIHIDFNYPDWDDLKNYKRLYEYIKEKFVPYANNYILIDEVQECEEFERAINGLHASESYRIYITGSNAFLMSSDLATLFTGRTYEIEVFPFSFKEFARYYEIDDVQTALDRYVREGGMAGSYLYDKEKEKYNYIGSVFKTLIVRDVRQKYKIRNESLLSSISEFLMDNIANLTSAKNIADSLVRRNTKTNDTTVGKYIGYLVNAFLFYKVRRYDIRGKQYLCTQDKYYLADHAFRFATLGTRNMDYGRVYENIVAIELKRRGYDVYVGVLYKKEIDFVAMRNDEKLYIQVADDISNPKTFERETSSLLNIKDAYPKILIAHTRHKDYSYEGIHIKDIANWLNEG